MPARSLALALLLLLFVMPAGLDAEPAGETVVLHLPPTMSSETVKGLIADLAAKGARPAEQLADPPPASGPALMTGMKLTVRIWAATKEAVRAVPMLSEAPQLWVRYVEAEGGTREAALRFWAIALAGLVAAPLIGLGMRAAFDRRLVVEPGWAPRLRAAFIKFLVAAGGLAVFAFLFLRRADGGLDGPANPRGDGRSAGLGCAAMAAFHRPVDHRCLAAPFGPPAAGDRRCRRARLFSLVLGLSGGCPVQLFCSVAGRAARLRPGRSIRCRDDLGAHNNCVQNRHVLGDPPPDRPRHPGGDRRRARSGPASGGGFLALVLHRAIARHILRLRD